MSSPNDRKRLHEARERTVAHLSDLFARGELDLDDFERLLDQAHGATDEAALIPVVQGLPAATALAPTTTTLVPASEAPAQQRMRSIFGSTERRGSWNVPRHLEVSAVFGNVELDFREARFPAGVVELDVRAVFGNVEIVVPPTLSVETDGTGILGNFEQVSRAPAVPDPDAPLLRVRGRAVLGNIEVTTRLAATENQRRAGKRHG